MKDHCRIGSLETWQALVLFYHGDHCRIGSLETIKEAKRKGL